MKVHKLQSLQNIFQILNGDAMHDETQNQERDKTEKHAQGYGKSIISGGQNLRLLLE